VRRLVRALLRRFGYDLVSHSSQRQMELAALADLPEAQIQTIRSVKPFTMTSTDRLAALINAVCYVSEAGIPGDIVECGVWRGGSMMSVASTLLQLHDRARLLYLYDTFEGMSAPSTADRSYDGVSAEEQLAAEPRGTGVWCYASLEDVRANLLSTGYPSEQVRFVKGKVEDTIPGSLPPRIALLRLDTDWYESTKHELRHLYPLLSPGGILIIDDYGHWQGARRAVDEYFQQLGEKVFLHRIDYTGRLLVKPAQ